MKKQSGEVILACVVLLFVIGGWFTTKMHKVDVECRKVEARGEVCHRE